MRHPFRVLAFPLAIAILSACSGTTSSPEVHYNFPRGVYHVALRTIDEASEGPCSVSTDGFIWYALAGGAQPPIDLTATNCSQPANLDSSITPVVPNWAHPGEPTHAIFVATSLQEPYSLAGMQAISRDAAAANVPVTWMIGNPEYISNDASFYTQLHSSYGDDVEVENNVGLYDLAAGAFSFFGPAVSVEGAGRERNIPGLLALGDGGFWGITWNSHGTDDTYDEGSPWGTFCSDITSYKRPSPTGDCSLVSFEWTARDLTRSYFGKKKSGHSAEAAFSTDPDDLLMNGGFSEQGAQAYERALVDAYAAAGVTQPLVMMSQQESIDEETYGAADDPVLGALYEEAAKVGMKTMTLRQALPLAKTFSAAPRAVAFPFIPGGMTTAYNGVPFTPATIDFHDDLAGMTFISGHTLPSRLYIYALDPVSTYDKPLVETLPASSSFPRLTGVSVTNGKMSFSFDAPAALHFGIALWTDPSTLGLTGSNVTRAGHAGVVVTFDLPGGASTESISCGGCTSTTFPYSQ